jgi:hypothetical protein
MFLLSEKEKKPTAIPNLTAFGEASKRLERRVRL